MTEDTIALANELKSKIEIRRRQQKVLQEKLDSREGYVAVTNVYRKHGIYFKLEPDNLLFQVLNDMYFQMSLELKELQEKYNAL